MVQISLSLGPGGGSGQVLPLNSDGSWSGYVTFNFSGVAAHEGAISASCIDITFGGEPFAQYQTHHAALFD